jgi:TonB family protein
MEFFIYLVKVNIAIVVMYAFYGLFFRNDTFFQWKRILLLFIPVFAALYPLIDIPTQLLTPKTLTAYNNIMFPVYYLNEMIITANLKPTGESFSVANYMPALLTGIYSVAVTILLIRILAQIGGVFFLLIQTKKIKINGQTVYRKKGLKTPFSFFRYIVLDPKQYPSHELQEIIRHEKTHVRQYHSLDKILVEAMTAFCWFNPFIWLMKKEICMNLEYLADRSVINSGLCREHYQLHLLRLTYHKAIATITNNFNVSPLKKRIFMMNKRETPRLGLVKYLSVLPVVAALLVFNICDISIVKAVTPDNVTLATLPVESAEPQVKDPDPVFQHVEWMPQFPGGDKELIKWLGENIKYPESAIKDSIQGRVVLRFIIRPDGSIDDVAVLRSLNSACDKEAVRVVNAMPKWIPGKQNDEPVSVYFNLPIVFKLSHPKDKK